MRLSLRNRLALFFFAITLAAIGALYIYVAPGLQTRLVNERLTELGTDAQRGSPRIMRTVGSSLPLGTVRSRVDAASLASGDRVTLLLVNRGPSGPQLSALADSSKLGASAQLQFTVGYRAVRRAAAATGTEHTVAGTVAESAVPVVDNGRPVAVIVFSAPVSDIVRSVSLVRHQILVAAAI